MNIRRHSSNYNFLGNIQTGVTFRWGDTLNEDPPKAPWPELADISISNHCSKGCSFCYRNSTLNGSFLSLKDYTYVLGQLTHPQWGSIFQVALGGGEPLEHPDFLSIIDETWRRNIIANFTTNGDHLTDKLAQAITGKVGAVAVSVTDFDPKSFSNIRHLLNNGIRTNLHFIVDQETLPTAISFLKGEYDHYLIGINAVVFLTYKSTGRASKNKCLKSGKLLDNFLFWVSRANTNLRFGFDACFVPLVLRKTNIKAQWVDSCECAFFSIYIDDEMNVRPCSFSKDPDYCFNLKNHEFSFIWEYGLESYRNKLSSNPCTLSCEKKRHCRGSCLFFPELFLCRSTDISECSPLPGAYYGT